jgi:hypothetical protein
MCSASKRDETDTNNDKQPSTTNDQQHPSNEATNDSSTSSSSNNKDKDKDKDNSTSSNDSNKDKHHKSSSSNEQQGNDGQAGLPQMPSNARLMLMTVVAGVSLVLLFGSFRRSQDTAFQEFVNEYLAKGLVHEIRVVGDRATAYAFPEAERKQGFFVGKRGSPNEQQLCTIRIADRKSFEKQVNEATYMLGIPEVPVRFPINYTYVPSQVNTIIVIVIASVCACACACVAIALISRYCTAPCHSPYVNFIGTLALFGFIFYLFKSSAARMVCMRLLDTCIGSNIDDAHIIVPIGHAIFSA